MVKTVTALNGALAIEAALKFKEEGKDFHLILMDLQMPVMDGFEATSKLKQLMKEGKILESHVIAVSGNDSEEDKRRSQESGVSEHLVKPLETNKLRETLKALGFKV